METDLTLTQDELGIMRDCLEIRGYSPTDEQLYELAEIYEECQEWDDDGNMLTGRSYDEIEDFVKHSSSVEEVLGSPSVDEASLSDDER